MNDIEAPYPTPPLRLALDREALAANWRALNALSGEAVAGAAVKADAYGLGAENVVPVLRDAGARDFFVAHWSEVRTLSRHVPPSSISVLHGPVMAEEAAFARSIGAVPVINSLHQARLWQASGGGRCHLMVDSGMSRLGVSPAQMGEPEIRALEVDILLSHLACADEDVAMNERQRRIFTELAGAIPARRRSLANSAGIVLGSAYHFDLTRPGLALYGGIPRPELASHLRQVVRPQVQVIQVRDLSPGDAVGYNATYVADRPMRAAVVALGYADGYLRSWSNGGGLFQGEAQLPLLGRISMDMTIVDASAAPEVQPGDWLDVAYHLPEAARRSGLSQYELLTLLGQRFDRR